MAWWGRSIVTSTSTPSVASLHPTHWLIQPVWAPTLVQLDQKGVAVAAHAAHSVIAMEDGTFRTFGNGDHGRLGCLDRFKRADPRDAASPVEMALPVEPKAPEAATHTSARRSGGARARATPPLHLFHDGLDHHYC